MKSLYNPTQDQDKPTLSEYFMVKLAGLFSWLILPAAYTQPLWWNPALWRALSHWSLREAVKWLQLSASSSSHKCLRLDLCLLRVKFTALCKSLGICDIGQAWPCVCVYSDLWPVQPGQVWGAITANVLSKKPLVFMINCYCSVLVLLSYDVKSNWIDLMFFCVLLLIKMFLIIFEFILCDSIFVFPYGSVWTCDFNVLFLR